MEKNKQEISEFNQSLESLFQGMDSFLSSKTVIGEPVRIDDTVIIPLVDVSFGVAAGAFNDDKKNKGAGGLGGKMSPSAVIVIHKGSTKLINIATNSGMDKLLDMVPDFVDKFMNMKKEKENPEARAKAADEIRDMVKDAANDSEGPVREVK